MEDDPFASLIPLCQPTSSQELKFQSCPFALQSDLDSTFEELTGIIMVSQPSSSNDGTTLHEEEEEEAFHTPQHSLSLLTTSEDQRPISPATVDLSKDTPVIELKKLGGFECRKGKSELPLTMKKKTISAKNGLFSDLLNDLNMFGAEIDHDFHFENVDFLQTAKNRGLIFPRPRWWPPEGFDD